MAAIRTRLTDDKRLALTNEEACRSFLLGSNWTKLRLGILYSYTDPGANLNNPTVAMGLVADPTKGWGNNVSGQHFVGLHSTGTPATWTRVAGPPAYFQDSVLGIPMALGKKVAGVVTDTTTAPYNRFGCAPDAQRNAFVIEFEKASPWNLGVVYTNSAAGAQSDITPTLMQNALDAATMSLVASQMSFYYTYMIGATLAVDEATHGYLDSVAFYWNRTLCDLEVSEVYVYKVS